MEIETKEKVFDNIFKSITTLCVYHPFETLFLIISLLISSHLYPTLVNNKSTSTLTKLTTTTATGSNASIKVDNDDDFSANCLFLYSLRFIIILFIYMKLKNIFKCKSNLLLTTLVFLTIITSLAITICFIYNFMCKTINFHLIFDLLLCIAITIDVKRCNLILTKAFKSSNLHVKSTIINEYTRFSSKYTLDTFVFLLLLALGNFSETIEIRFISKFGLLTLISNYISFIIIYPALLSLILQFHSHDSNDLQTRKNENNCDNQTSSLKLSSNRTSTTTQQQAFLVRTTSRNTNPVTINVKIVMIVFLLIIHIKWNFFENKSESESNKTLNNNNNINNSNKILIDNVKNDDALTNNYAEICILLSVITYLAIKFTSNSSFNLLNDDNELSNGENDGDETIEQRESKTQVTKTKIDDKEKEIVNYIDKSIQVYLNNPKIELNNNLKINNNEKRSIEDCLEIFKNSNNSANELNDDEVIQLIKTKHLQLYKLESHFDDPIRAVIIRRKHMENNFDNKDCLDELPYECYDYKRIIGKCCENVIGYVPIPLGVAGPLLIDNKLYSIPMATTEGTLVASTNRGCSALTKSNGVFTKLLSDGITRGPVLRLPTASYAADIKKWVEEEDNFLKLKKTFDSTSRFAKLESIKCCVAGRFLYTRFVSSSGDAMGMNMISKGCEKALGELKNIFPQLEIISLSGNYCTDKKPSAINWIDGRGKSVVCEATIPGHLVKSVLKTSPKALVDLNIAKNLVGSAMAGSIGGFNAHAANIVAAIFIACGQDPAQVVESSSCLTWMECSGKNMDDLYVSCTMPSIEVGTIGGGTGLSAQLSCLKMLNVNGAHESNPGENACTLARIICATVLAGELSLMSALAAGHLVNSHMKYNRDHANDQNIQQQQQQSQAELHAFL